MQLFRSMLFNIAFYLNTAIQMIFWTPFYFLVSRKRAWWIVKFWSRSNSWLLKQIVGTRMEVSGLENLPDGGYIIAPKHQSAWDTFALLPWQPDPVYILKRELMWIPLFGWYVARMKMVPINRGQREQAVRLVNKGAKRALDEGRQLLIYPEGTRRPPGAEPAYKSGIGHLYEQLDVPVVPVVHQAGLFWPKNRIIRHPGLIKVKILEPIEPGLARSEFTKRLIETMEEASDALLLDVADQPDHPPLPPIAQARIEALRGKS